MIDENVIKQIEIAETPNDLAKILLQLFRSGISVWKNEDGSEIFYNIRARVDSYNGVKFEIRPRDHAPPHFHVTYGNQSATFSIKDGDLINGNIGIREKRIVKHYYELAKPKIIEMWNKMRASDSMVGKYTGEEI